MRLTRTNTYEQIPAVLTPKLIYDLGLYPGGVNQVYQLFRRDDFPAIRHGKRLLVGREAFFEWLNRADRRV